MRDAKGGGGGVWMIQCCTSFEVRCTPRICSPSEHPGNGELTASRSPSRGDPSRYAPTPSMHSAFRAAAAVGKVREPSGGATISMKASRMIDPRLCVSAGEKWAAMKRRPIHLRTLAEKRMPPIGPRPRPSGLGTDGMRGPFF